MNKISFSIEYAGIQLPVAKNAGGQDVTPLKPISDLFGLQWRRQHKKVTESEFLSRFLGVCMVPMYHADGQKREQICILVSQVSYFLMNINLDQVRAQGNTSSADFLEEKITEWIAAIHDYESLGQAINLNHAKHVEALRKQRSSFAQMIGVKIKPPNSTTGGLLAMWSNRWLENWVSHTKLIW
jgi:hypothetical protein